MNQRESEEKERVFRAEYNNALRLQSPSENRLPLVNLLTFYCWQSFLVARRGTDRQERAVSSGNEERSAACLWVKTFRGTGWFRLVEVRGTFNGRPGDL